MEKAIEKKSIKKLILFTESDVSLVAELAAKSDRSFSSQIREMVRQYSGPDVYVRRS
jgi:hypothetical protein